MFKCNNIACDNVLHSTFFSYKASLIIFCLRFWMRQMRCWTKVLRNKSTMFTVIYLHQLKSLSSLPRCPMKYSRWHQNSWRIPSEFWWKETNWRWKVINILFRFFCFPIVRWIIDWLSSFSLLKSRRYQTVFRSSRKRRMEIRHPLRPIWHTDHHPSRDLLQHQKKSGLADRKNEGS